MQEGQVDPSAARGVKRKRYEPPEEEMSVRVGGKLHHEMKEVHKASKKAKVFETQKVVKRLKDLRKKDESDKSIVGFEAELTALKEIDHDVVGNTALRSKVLKDHSLRENEDVKAAMTKELEDNLVVPAAPGTTLAKIQSRLLSSKILATQVTASMNSLKFLLNPALKQRDSVDIKPDPPPLAQSPDRPSKIRKGSVTSHDAPAPRKLDEPTKLATVDSEEDGADSDSSGDDAGWESGSVDGVGEFNDDGWESGSIGSAHDLGESGDEESDEDSDSGDEELQVKPVKGKPQTPKTLTATKPAKLSSAKMESTFLPSLSVGFVRGADDSDFSDVEDAAADMPKKNRRGQRARQAIWEKKFGRNANHKKKEAEALATAPPPSYKNKSSARPINSGSNAVRIEQGPPGSRSTQTYGKNISQHKQPGDSGWGGRSKDVSTPASRPLQHAAAKSDKNEQKLHPSWEAKRKLKEKESAGIVPSQGTKIKFT
ncbi:hypothetical protein HYPSUDRAFT_46837 [Hypholoma sublateritium FD-334 SS-4]|uniref:Bud22 domain-containing protein n=1 Tax=Hypholoma sublateritium (strain FD-334 SS-4) TaxID=945553 RepID=A0A0D2NJZ7_HYPSF|nr:hypothetical protein HYPSUDRAFT_46837 [Hypholoma sublateritium FD-334 SS-4]